MAKAKNPKRATPPKGNNTDDGLMGWLIKILGGLGKIINQIGISRFVIIAITLFIFRFATNSQKEEIIDTWVLFKGESGSIASIFLNIFFICLLVFQQIHYKRVEKLDKERIKELADKKSELQSEKIGQELSTSQT